MPRSPAKSGPSGWRRSGIPVSIARPWDVYLQRLKEKHKEFYNQKMPELEQLKSVLRMKKPPETPRPPQYQTPWAGEGALAQEHRAVQKQTVKFKPLDHPEFDGKAKNYARFKQRFDEMITSSFDSMGSWSS